MSEIYRVTPQPVVGQQGPTVIRGLDRYAQEQATTVPQMTVRDFPPWVVAQIDEATDGETATTTNFAMVVTLMARLGAAHGLRCVPLVMADAVTMTDQRGHFNRKVRFRSGRALLPLHQPHV
jgi:hypothetical protein